jgi:hypothetical protein
MFDEYKNNESHPRAAQSKADKFMVPKKGLVSAMKLNP